MESVRLLWGLVVALLLLVAGTSVSAWTYDDSGEEGPSNWYKTYPACGGSSQSPIDLTSPTTLPGGYLRLYAPLYPNSELEWENNGHTLELVVKDQLAYLAGSTLPHVMSAVQFHFHTPSEHTVNGQHYPMELHLVTNSSAAGPTSPMAVVGMFFQVGPKRSRLLDMLLEYVEKVEEEVVLPRILTDIASKIGPEFYEYSGSLTTPPCSEIVHWMVTSAVETATQDQIDAFADVMGHNNRPVQALNGRVITNRLLTAAPPCPVVVSGFGGAFAAMNGGYAPQAGIRGGKPWYHGERPGHVLFFQNGNWKIAVDGQPADLWASIKADVATPDSLPPTGASWVTHRPGEAKTSARVTVQCAAA